MRLIASLIVKNEISRYLELCIQALLEYVDEIRVLDDGSDDGTYEWLLGRDRVFLLTNAGQRFFEHEGRARQALLEWTMQGHPSHILAIDADEFVSDGQQLRTAVEDDPAVVFTLLMEEVWKTTPTSLFVRADGGWRPHPVPILFHVPRRLDRRWQIQQRALACGREPTIVRNFAVRGKAKDTGCSIFHFGWTKRIRAPHALCALRRCRWWTLSCLFPPREHHVAR